MLTILAIFFLFFCNLRPTLTRLRDSGKINGIMVIHLSKDGRLTDVPASFSPDKTCPLDDYGKNSSHVSFSCHSQGFRFFSRLVGQSDPWHKKMVGHFQKMMGPSISN